MVGAAAVPLGVLAACIVLFVPMSLAGYHLSRNKMLFFSGALFITLAVAVHIAPYIPSLLSSSSPPPLPSSCLLSLHAVSFNPPTWSWPPSAPCALRPLAPADASLLLNGSSILIAGDSQARLLTLALLRLLLPPSPDIESALFRRHSDYQIHIPASNIHLNFIWAPYPANLTAVPVRSSDVLVLGAGLWHMLHSTNATDYGLSLSAVRRSVDVVPVSAVHMFWLGMPALVNEMLNTEEKRERMNQTVWEAYDREVDRSRILRGSGGPLLLLDVAALSRKCGRRCTEDGMHYDGVVYEAALHIMLNALLIESQQRI